jgi:hypothetical protein
VRVAFGAKAHSGWAALVVLGDEDGRLVVVDRRRMPLVEDEQGRQPYHAAEHLEPRVARALVERGIAAARRVAVSEMRAAVNRAREQKHDVQACAVLVGDPMPAWSTDEILAVHFRMHKAEGVVFRDVLLHATEECGLTLVVIPEKQLAQHAGKALASQAARLMKELAAVGKSVGPPWGKDQKDAALAALIALRNSAA